MKSPLRILHLEDSGADAELVRETLAGEDITCDVRRAETGEVFLAALEEGGFDIILADHNLPSFDGSSALALAREKCPDVPFIVLSGSLGEDLAIETLKSGATDYVLKHRLNRLGLAVRRALHEAEERVERKRAEEALRQSNGQLVRALADLRETQQQLIQQERLRALGQMASGVAHDFNNALAAIVGFSELLLHRPEFLEGKEEARRYVEMMNTAAQDAGKVVDRLREFYRHREENEALAAVDLNELVTQTISLTQPKWKAQAEAHGNSIDVRTELWAVPDIAGNAANLREVLTNLIFNAVDAMPQGGTITVRTRRDDGHVVLEVVDTGTGMTEETRHRCLEPFFTTKGDHGTGLGLSMVYGIVQRHDGTIDIQTEVGKGTTFSIRLPAQLAQAQTESPATPARTTHHLHVLLVEDEAVVRKVVGEYLKHDGHIVEAAKGGLDGLEKFRNGQFDLVLLDRAMPDVSGDQVAAAIKSADPKVAVVMLTGFGSMMDATGEKPVGVDFVVSKPVTIDTLRRAIARAVGNN